MRGRATIFLCAEQAREQVLGAAVTGLLDLAVLQRLRLLIVEDIQWADSLMLSILAALAEAASRRAAILVMSSRFDGEPLDPRWRAGSDRRVSRRTACGRWPRPWDRREIVPAP